MLDLESKAGNQKKHQILPVVIIHMQMLLPLQQIEPNVELNQVNTNKKLKTHYQQENIQMIGHPRRTGLVLWQINTDQYKMVRIQQKVSRQLKPTELKMNGVLKIQDQDFKTQLLYFQYIGETLLPVSLAIHLHDLTTHIDL